MVNDARYFSPTEEKTRKFMIYLATFSSSSIKDKNRMLFVTFCVQRRKKIKTCFNTTKNMNVWLVVLFSRTSRIAKREQY